MEPSWGHLGAILGPSWAILGPSWAIQRQSWATLGPPRAILGPPSGNSAKMTRSPNALEDSIKASPLLLLGGGGPFFHLDVSVPPCVSRPWMLSVVTCIPSLAYGLHRTWAKWSARLSTTKNERRGKRRWLARGPWTLHALGCLACASFHEVCPVAYRLFMTGEAGRLSVLRRVCVACWVVLCSGLGGGRPSGTPPWPPSISLRAGEDGLAA